MHYFNMLLVGAHVSLGIGLQRAQVCFVTTVSSLVPGFLHLTASQERAAHLNLLHKHHLCNLLS